MRLFGRRDRSGYDASIVRGVGITALHSEAGWTLLNGQRSAKRTVWDETTEVTVADGDTAALARAIPAALRRSLAAKIAGGGERLLPEEVATHPLVAGDWVRATAAGVRRFTVSLGADVTVMRWAMTVRTTPPGPHGDDEPYGVAGVAGVTTVGAGATSKLQVQHAFDDWRAAIDADDWPDRRVWKQVTDFLVTNADAPGLISAWWTPDAPDRSRADGPLHPDHAQGDASTYLNGDEYLPDHAGPPGVGFADPGVTGRWCWLHRWTPFDGRPPAEAFTGAIGLVITDDGTVRCFLWPDRDTVRRVRVRGQDSWAVTDRKRVTGLYTALAGANDVPAGWELLPL